MASKRKTEIVELGAIWMELRDRKRLARLMIVQEMSQRRLARLAGWSTHSYLSRLINGTAKNVEPEPALRIANALQVGVEDLFLTKVARNIDQSADKSDGNGSGKKVA